ncbi:MAG: hypothetical protein ACJ758_04305 [Actinomycetota bacterium]
MTDGPGDGRALAAGSPLRTPRAAGVAGIVFSVLLILCIVLLRISVPEDVSQPGLWLTDSGRRSSVALALGLVPFAGIAFLWFVGVIRDRIGEREDRFFATVFLGSGLLFVGMLFIAAAVAGGLIADVAASSAPSHAVATVALGRRITSIALNVYAMRMAAVFTTTTAMIGLRTGAISRWLGIVGLVFAVVLLFGMGLSSWVALLFPAWIGAVSVEILLTQWRA